MSFQEIQDQKVIMSLDTPLSWPQNLSILCNHKVSDLINQDKEFLSKCKTDRFVEQKIGNRVLSIGADRIARTAYNFYRIIFVMAG